MADAENYMKELGERMERERVAAEEKAKSGVSSLADLLAIAGAEIVEIYFDGSGDSGSIEDLAARDEKEEIISIPATIKEKLEDWAYGVLEGTGVDWYNNDGGFGTIILDVKERKYSFEVSQRETTSSVQAAGEVLIP